MNIKKVLVSASFKDTAHVDPNILRFLFAPEKMWPKSRWNTVGTCRILFTALVFCYSVYLLSNLLRFTTDMLNNGHQFQKHRSLHIKIVSLEQKGDSWMRPIYFSHSNLISIYLQFTCQGWRRYKKLKIHCQTKTFSMSFLICQSYHRCVKRLFRNHRQFTQRLLKYFDFIATEVNFTSQCF